MQMWLELRARNTVRDTELNIVASKIGPHARSLAEMLKRTKAAIGEDAAKCRFVPHLRRSKLVGGCTCGEGQLFPVPLRHGPSTMSPDPPTLQMVLSAHTRRCPCAAMLTRNFKGSG